MGVGVGVGVRVGVSVHVGVGVCVEVGVTDAVAVGVGGAKVEQETASSRGARNTRGDIFFIINDSRIVSLVAYIISEVGGADVSLPPALSLLSRQAT